MANAADRLFETILGQLPQESHDAIPDWPAFADTDDAPPLGGPNDTIVSYDTFEVGLRVADRIGGTTRLKEPSAEERALIEGGLRARGLDALAFYKSRRLISEMPFPDAWGIFYLEQGLAHVAWDIAQAYPGYKDPRTLAHGFLKTHEHFHFRADLQTLLFEATLGKHLYLPLRRALRGGQTHFVEEALANKQAFNWAKKDQIGLREYASEFMAVQPHAYSRFNEPLVDLAGEWAANVVNLRPPGCPPRHDLAPWVEATPKDFMRRSLCPEYVIYPQRLETWLPPAWIPPPVIEVIDAPELAELLSKKYSQLRGKWEETKRKLKENHLLRGLNFKKWPKGGNDVYSVRVGDNFRAHLRNLGNGRWLAYLIGTHKQMGHG